MAGPVTRQVNVSRPGTLLLGGAAVLPERVVETGAVLVSGDRIAYAGPRDQLPPGLAAGAEVVDLGPGTRLLPGLVDLHCHGGAGAEFGPDEESAGKAASYHHRAGTTTVVASLVSALPEVLLAGVRTCAGLAADETVAGVHVEGPFLSPQRCGAQDPDALRPVDLDLVAALDDAAGGYWSVMTFAPELDGADGLVSRLAAAGVTPAVGHTDGDAATAARALRAAQAAGTAPLVTHLFNAMPPLHHRFPGAAAACLTAAARGDAVVELVADGVHLADETVAMVMALGAPGSVVLVTDAMAAAGMPDGRYRLGRLEVAVAGGTARLADGGAIAGGTSTLLDVVRRCVVSAGVDLARAVRAASADAAAVLGLEGEVGALSAGTRADVLAVDASLAPVAVWRHGRLLD